MTPLTAQPDPAQHAGRLALLTVAPIIVALLIALTMLAGPALAADSMSVAPDSTSAPVSTSAPDRWVVGCRHLSSSEVTHASADQFKYWREADGQWQVESADSYAAAPSGATTIYVHGNQISSSAAFHTARQLARALDHDNATAGGRLVTFSWPSARIGGNQVRDARVKATRSDRYAPALSHFIAAQPDDVQINLIGHSYGARLIAVALDDLADNHAPRSGPIHAVLLAAALSNSWLLPGHRCGAAMSCVESLTVTTSPTDRVLRWYPLLWGVRNRGPAALGDSGLACRSQLGDNLAKYEQISVSCTIGKSHDWRDYLATSRVRQTIRQLMQPANQ